MMLSYRQTGACYHGNTLEEVLKELFSSCCIRGGSKEQRTAFIFLFMVRGKPLQWGRIYFMTMSVVSFAKVATCCPLWFPVRQSTEQRDVTPCGLWSLPPMYSVTSYCCFFIYKRTYAVHLKVWHLLTHVNWACMISLFNWNSFSTIHRQRSKHPSL